MRGKLKRFYVDPEAPGGYAFKHKIMPFISGLFELSPLVEVALEGLRRNVGGDTRKMYERRIAAHGTTEQMHAAMLTELEPDVQNLMAVCFVQRYRVTLAEQMKKVESSESGMHGYNLVREGERYVKATMEQVTRLLRSGTVTTEKAQTELAGLICHDGTEAQAGEIIAGGKVTSRFALHMLTFKRGGQKEFDA